MGMMRRPPSSGIQREWYSVSAESLRRGLQMIGLLALVVVAFVGYRFWQRSAQEHRAQGFLADCTARVDALAESLGAADARRQHPEVWKHLEDARAAFAAGDVALAADLGQRCLAVAESALHPDQTIIQLVRMAGGVESRHGQVAPWRPMSGGERLRIGDWVKTADNGSAELLFAGGASLTLRPGTLVHLDAQLTDLAFGDVEVATATEERTVATPGARARFGRGSEAQISVAADGSTSRVMVAEGGAEVTTDAGETRHLEPLEQVTRQGGRWSAVGTVLGRPQLVEPADRRLIDPAAGELTLAWDPVVGARGYRLQVAAGPLFTDNLVDGERVDPAARLRVRETGSYCWRVAAVDVLGNQGPWSLPRTFRVGSAPAVGRDRIPPRLRIDEVEIFGNLVIVTGLSDPDAEVTVEGQKALVRIDGTFRKTIELKEKGRQTIRIVATDSAGNRTVRTRQVVIL